MKYIVCAHYCGTVIELETFENKDLAEEFAMYPCELYSADETEDGIEDEIIYPDEMWVEEQSSLPFSDLPRYSELFQTLEYEDELPF